ncbi:RabX4 [Blastocystis sp. ATCC 50177/Nand II]|uniref:RabX4 n=1 Tax=Blastocystis sp. subtype 1 (strain ATCC 50177 / NandII) TaxID=478820 RepID=A0A196S6V7_BLAHN|nr:RabX4 [Blastocystis sp. ATCC 50177/Nand II]
MDIDELGIPDELELLNLGDLEKELAKNSGRSIETDSSTSSSESSSTDEEEVPMLTEEEIMQARNSRYGRRRSQSIDYGSQGRGSLEYEQTPEQALYSHSVQLLRTIPRFQYEAPSWVPNLEVVQDTQAEMNAEEMSDYQNDTLPIEIDGRRYTAFTEYRIAILGNVGVGKTSLIRTYFKKPENTMVLATNGVEYTEEDEARDGVCVRVIFCDFSGQERLRPVLKEYLKRIDAAVLVTDVTQPDSLEALSSFYLPELAALHSSELVVHAVLNKTDLEGTLTRSDVMKVVKPFVPDAEVFLTNKNNRNSVRSVFRGMLGTVQNEIERGCFSCKR